MPAGGGGPRLRPPPPAARTAGGDRREGCRDGPMRGGGTRGDIMQGDTLRCEREGEIGHLVLDRPAVLNAVNERMTVELEAALREIGADAGVRVLVVKGEGRGFCSGLDLREAAARAIDRQGQDEQPTSPWFRALDLLEKLDKLTIASIHGPCLGSGLELALGCDFRIAEEAAVFSMPQVLYGGVAEGGPAYRLPQPVGLAEGKGNFL